MAIITVTSTTDSGAGSLREAIANAQSGDTIKFASALANEKIVLTSGEIKVLQPITIDGSDAPNLAISGNERSRVFNIGNRDNRINVTIKNLTFTDGRAVSGTLDDTNIADGGAIRIHDFSDAIVENSTFRNNVAERGGAIRVNYGGSLTVRNSNFDSNDGSIANDGFSAGAIATNGSNGEPGFDPGNGFLKIEGSTFTNNKGSVGGAVYSLLGPLTIEDSTFKNNESTGEGGAIFTDGADKSEKDGKGGEIIIRRTNIEGNKAISQGGGLFLWTYETDRVLIEDSTIARNTTIRGGRYNESKGGGLRVANGHLTIRNTTLAENAADQQGGALWVDSDEGVTIENSTFSSNKIKDDQGGAITMNTPDGTPVQVTNSTFVNNSAGRDAGTIWTNGGNSDDVTLTNTIFAGGTAGVTKQGNTNYQLKDGGGNFVENVSGNRGPKVTATAEYVDDLKLSDTLQTVGDDLMHVLEDGSPAINSGTTNGATANDQRGVPRDSQPDAGAFEFVPSSPASVPSNDNSNNGNNTIANAQVTIPIDDFIDPDKLLIDLREVDLNQDGEVDSGVFLTFDEISSEASYNNSAGFYKIASTDGAVRDSMTDKLIYPNDAGYAQAALKQRVSGGEMNRNTGKLVSQFDGGDLYAPYLIANGTTEQFLNDPSNNLQAFFNYGEANLDKTSHVKLLDKNQFGFEDQLNAQNPDFNDLSFKAKTVQLA